MRCLVVFAVRQAATIGEVQIIVMSDSDSDSDPSIWPSVMFVFLWVCMYKNRMIPTPGTTVALIAFAVLFFFYLVA